MVYSTQQPNSISISYNNSISNIYNNIIINKIKNKIFNFISSFHFCQASKESLIKSMQADLNQSECIGWGPYEKNLQLFFRDPHFPKNIFINFERGGTI